MNINTRHDSKVHLPVIRCQFHTHQTAWCRKGPRPRSHHHGTSIVSAPGHVIASTKTCAVSPGLRLLGRRRRNLITTPPAEEGKLPRAAPGLSDSARVKCLWRWGARSRGASAPGSVVGTRFAEGYGLAALCGSWTGLAEDGPGSFFLWF